MTRAVVTGSSGFLGAEVCRQALASGLAVRAVARRPRPIPGAESCAGDLRDQAHLAALMSSADVVVHAAGMAHVFSRADRRRADFWEGNVEVTRAVVDAAVRAGVRRVVIASSVAVYGGAAVTGPDESTVPAPHGPYAESKLAAEAEAAAIAQRSTTGLTILRLATLYGAGDPGNVRRLIASLCRGWFIQPGSGRNRKSLLHVSDAARACLLAALSADAGVQRYNVTAPPVGVSEIVAAIRANLSRPVTVIHVPVTVARLAAHGARILTARRIDPVPTLQKWLSDEVFSAERIRADLGFVADVPLAVGIREEVRWLVRHETALGGTAAS